MSHGWNKCIECGQHYHEAEEVRGECPLCAKKKHKIKPTIWRDNASSMWICAVIEGDTPLEGTEAYCKWIAAGGGDTIQEAYAEWLKEADEIYEDCQGKS